jgi:hypothetical protein
MKEEASFCVVLSLIIASSIFAGSPLEAELVKVAKIWDRAPHNAFTDLARWNGTFYCAFREGTGHVSADGKIRVLKSKDADLWDPAALVALAGYDLRDAHLSVTPDNKLMLLGASQARQSSSTYRHVCMFLKRRTALDRAANRYRARTLALARYLE